MSTAIAVKPLLVSSWTPGQQAAASQFAAGCIEESLLTGLTPSARGNLAEALKSLPDLGEEWKQRQSSLAQGPFDEFKGFFQSWLPRGAPFESDFL
ncbi:hypothetical protein AK812_SmicGene32774 [Symbiodinium microadriaticum]|uniref:Uncharacterized protein n=1 Tax=Symbiodinium microadriaticum TaxID=2951 RepID=A0A1Q9CT98_SYMMI|nr:hypothetical protein AK812_SmicGene32774 [Symbiodinium microadriaticum]